VANGLIDRLIDKPGPTCADGRIDGAESAAGHAAGDALGEAVDGPVSR
jgi:hypothetical protein